MMRRVRVALRVVMALVCAHCSKEPAASKQQGTSVTTDPKPRSTPPGDTYGYGPPWGELWCVGHTAIDTEALIIKYARPGLETSINDRACRTGMRIEGPELEAYYVVSCGTSSFTKGAMYDSSVFDTTLGVRSRQQRLENAFVLDVWDTDVPCDVSVTWSKQSPEVNRARAYALAKDLLDQLTPESIKRPRVDLVVTAEDKTGDKARAALARFRDRASTVQHYAPLAPGFPKVIKSDDYPELEPGNTYLLFGICPGGSGQQMADVLDAALPSPYANVETDVNFTTLTVDGLGLPRACPESMNPSSLGAWTEFWKLDDDRLLFIGLVDALHMTTPGKPRLKGAAFLYTKDDQLLDTLPIEEPFPLTERVEGRYGTMIDVSYEDCRVVMQQTGTPRFSFGCYVDRGDQECSEKPFWGKSFKLKVTDDDKLSVESSSHTSSGGVCRPKSEFTVNPY